MSKNKNPTADKLTVSEKVKGVLENVRARGLKDLVDPNVWRTYAEWSDIEKNGLVLPPEAIVSFAQQLVYRMVMCGECVRAGKCASCKCAIPQKMCCAAAKDALGRWPEMMPPEEWNEFFKDFEFSIVKKAI